MSIYEVINVGQGDCILIKPPQKCRFKNNKIFVDLGNGNCDITQNVFEDDEVSIFLTHHHEDHIGGFNFFATSLSRIRDIYLPLYQNEVTLIVDFMLHLKGIEKSKKCQDFIDSLNRIKGYHTYLKHIERKENGPSIKFAYEGMKLCDHIKCLNPPLHLSHLISSDELDMDEMKTMASEMFTDDYARVFLSYIQNRNWNLVDKEGTDEIDKYWIVGQDSMGNEMIREGRGFVAGFIIRNSKVIQEFNRTGKRKYMKKLYENLIKTEHDSCIVLRTSFEGETMLLTGDASEKVFERLIDNGIDISADYLKVPHHGSKNNLNAEILNHIRPKVAIISHDNRKYGKDTHPNTEILDLLEEKGVKLMLTNSVKKNGITIKDKNNYRIDPNKNVEIIDI